MHCAAYDFEHVLFMSVFLTDENPTDLTHMNGPAADTFGCCLLMHGGLNSVQHHHRYDKKINPMSHLEESNQSCYYLHKLVN